MWILAAVGSALFAGLTSILAKCGIRTTDSDIATALRTIVVLVFAWIMVGISGQLSYLGDIDLRSFFLLALSGMATGLSWICYFKALSLGDVNKVVPIDKTSTVLTVLLAIILFGETNYLPVKLIGCAVLLVGTYLMIDHQNQDHPIEGWVWLVYALISAVMAALTSILARLGMNDVPSNLATAVRTCFVLVMAWVVVAGKGKLPLLKQTNGRELAFILTSGLATGASWLCYYYAIQMGVVSVVVPIDKLSIVVTVAFSVLVLHEHVSKRALVGLGLIVGATIVMALFA